MSKFFALFLLLLSAPAMAAETPMDWAKTFSALSRSDDPVAPKLLEWLTVTETRQPVTAEDLMRFARENPGWPRLYLFRERLEKDTDLSGLHKPDISAWFDQNPPKTAEGIKLYVSALISLGHTEKARTALAKFWENADLSRKETTSLAARYQNVFPPNAHVSRMENLLWNFRYQEADYMLPLLSPARQSHAKAVIGLGRLASNAPTLLKNVPETMHADPLLVYARIKWRRQKDKDDDAIDLLKRMPKNPPHPELWWRERSILARRMMEEKDYARAYRILKAHNLPVGGDYSQAEWQMGWLALRFLNQPAAAYQHFDNFYKAVNSAVSRARGAYWIARATEAMGNKDISQGWDRYGSQFASAFYGQICHEKLYGAISAAQFADDNVAPPIREAFNSQENVRAVRLLAKLKLTRYADPFFIKLLDKAKDRQDYLMIAVLAREVSRPYFSVESNKQAQQKLGAFLFTEGYPMLPSVPVSQPERALIHAIVHRESMFDTRAESPAGARGLMQLMPATARQVSKKAGKKYSADKLMNNPQYNIEIGSRYLQSLINDYDGYYPLAIAAYNAGPGNVDSWIRQFGDPRKGNIPIIDWIELIPIYETRNYVQRVMESYYLYKLKMSEKPKTVFDFG